MKKNKGFTLIELVGAIIILGIVILIAVPTISRFISKGKIKYYHSLESMVTTSARDYLEDYRALLPRGEVGNVTVINGEELLANNYIDKIADTKGNMCEAYVAAKKTGTNEYEYHTCLKCNKISIDGYEYESDETECEYINHSEEENKYIDTSEYTIEIDLEEILNNYELDSEGRIIVAQSSKFDLPIAVVKKNGVEQSAKVVATPSSIDTNVLGPVTVKYIYHGVVKELNIIVVDKQPPVIAEIVLRKGSNIGDKYTGGWSSKDIYHEFKATDYTTGKVLGSGIKRYDISQNGTTWEPLESNTYVTNKDGIYTYYVRAVDNDNNVSEVRSYEVKVDKQEPGLTLKVTGDLRENDWYISDVTLENVISDNISDLYFTSIRNKTKNEIIYTKSIANINERLIGPHTAKLTENTLGDTVTGVVTDFAGNTVTDTKTIKIDKYTSQEIGTPILTISDGIASGSWHNKAFTISFSGSSSLSGIEYFYSTNRNELVNQTYNSLMGKANSNTSKDRNKVIKASSISHTDNIVSLNYYVIACNQAGTCTDISSYEAKLDTITPNSPIITATDNITTGEWHNQNVTLNYSGANNISGNTYYYGTTNNPQTIGTSTYIDTNTTGITYYAKVCSGSGLCSTVSNYLVKLDNVTPSIVAKLENSYLTYNTTYDLTGLFNISFGVSGGNTTCIANNSKDVINNTELELGINKIICTSKSVAGLSYTTETILHHQYTASGSCSSGSLSNNNACYFQSNASVCGETPYDCNPYDCNGYDCNPHDCNPYECGGNVSVPYTTTCTGSGSCGNNCNCGCPSYYNGCSLSCNCNPDGKGGNNCSGGWSGSYNCTKYKSVYQSKTCYHTCYDTCYHTCYHTCYSANSCNRTYPLSYSCPNNGINHIDGTSIIPSRDNGVNNGTTYTTIPTCSF